MGAHAEPQTDPESQKRVQQKQNEELVVALHADLHESSPSACKVVLMGETGCGKTALVNFIAKVDNSIADVL